MYTSLDEFMIIYIILEVLIAIVAVVGNTVVCYVVLRSSVLRKKIMYMFVTSLAMADLSVGVIVIPLAILTKLGLPYNSPTLCVVLLSLIMIPTQISIFNLMTISIERYLAIRHPRIHYSKLTTDKAFTMIVFTWIVSVLIGLLPTIGWNNVKDVFFQNVAHPTTRELDSSNVTAPVTLTAPTTDGWSSLETTLAEENTVLQCIFVEVMDKNFLFFNFASCVLPPLLTSAILYFIIFLRLTKTYSPSPSPLLNMKTPCKAGTYENSPILKRKAQAIQSQHSNGNRHDEVMDYTKSNHQTSLLVPHESSIPNKKIMKTRNVYGVKESIDTSEKSSLHRNIQHVDSAAGLNQKYSIDGKLLRDKLNVLAKEGKCESNACPSHNGLKLTKEKETGSCNSAASSYLSTPQLMRSRTGTDISLATKRRLQEARHHKRMKEIKAAAVLGLIVLAFAICWLPIHILNTVVRFGNIASPIPPYVFDITILLSHANSAVNFILYSWRLKAFRDELHKVFSRVTLFSCINKN